MLNLNPTSMPGTLLTLLSLLGVGCCGAVPLEGQVHVPDEMITKLFKLVQDDQIKNSMSSQLPSPLYRQSGLYSSFAKNNFHGKPSSAIGRTLGMYDNNLFTTNFINTMLIEAHRRGRSPAPSFGQLRASLNLAPQYIDKNRPYNNSIVAYWPLIYDKKADFWQSHPNNALMMFELLKTFQHLPLSPVFKLLGYSDIGAFIEHVEKNSEELKGITFIPMEIDCTFISLGLGSVLLLGQNKLPLAWDQWKSYNTNVTSAFDALKEYSYRPFSGDRDSRIIDPRTYFVFRHFLDESKASGKDVALPTTWTQSQKEQRWQRNKGMVMFRNVNNVCLGVTANVVYGITSSILSGLVDVSVLDDPLITQIYHNSSALLLHSVASNMTGRPDLALVYYPSRVQVEWFISRSLAIFEDAARKDPPSSPILKFVHDALKKALRIHVTERLLSEAQHGNNKTFFFEGFLGTDDYSESGAEIKTGGDRIYSTAMALNVLINSWTSFNPEKQTLTWVQDTPQHVRVTASRAAHWLVLNTFGGKFKPGGAFFAGSYKWERTWPNSYPGNRYQFYNGTVINDWSSQKPSMYNSFSMEGYVTPDNYAAMLDQKWFGRTTPRDFHGYNTEKKNFFIYWESEPVTYTITMLGLSMYRNIEE